MQKITPPKAFKLYAKQHAAIYNPARFMWIPAGTKSGKTEGCQHYGYCQSTMTQPRHGLWVEPNYASAKILGFDRMKAKLSKIDPGGTIWFAREADLELHFRNGSFIRYMGGDKPDSIYGPDYHWAVIDEASRCKEAVWLAVLSTLTTFEGPCRIIGNVKGRKNWFWREASRAKAGAPDYGFQTLTSYDAAEAEIIPKRAVDSAREALKGTPGAFEELYLGIPTEDGANPFGIPAIRKAIRPGTGEVVVWGVDLAKSHDWTVACGLDDTGAVAELQRWQGPWEITTQRLVDLIGDTPALIDSTGVGDPIVERLQLKCPNVEGFKFTAESKQSIMLGLAAAIQTGEVGITPGVMQDELESFEYEYGAGGKVRYSAPEGLFDDCVCAAALAVRHRAQAARRPTFSFRMIEDDDGFDD